MSSQSAPLIYRIAEQYMLVHSPRPEATNELLSNYKPFRVEAIPQGIEPVLEIFGGYSEPFNAEKSELIETTQEPSFASRLFRTEDGGMLLVMTSEGRTSAMKISPDGKRVFVSHSLASLVAYPVLNRFVTIAFGLAIAPLGYLKMHASVTKLGDRALVLMGVSGTGKSTHSRLLRTYVPGAHIINDDEPIVRRLPDGTVRVWGCPWSGSTPCYVDSSAEVAAFLYLYQSPDNKLTRLEGLEAFQSLFSSVAILYSSHESQEQNFRSVADILAVSSIYRLDCRPDEGAVALTRELLIPPSQS